MKVLFSNTYFYKLDAKQWEFKQPYPPLGTIQAAAVARAQSFAVGLFDTNLKNNPGEISLQIKREKPEILVIYDDGFNYLTKMCLTVMREAAFELIREGKKSGCPVIVSSSDSTDRYEMYLNEGADFIIRGEGEETLKELLDAIVNNKSLHTIQGIAYREGENIIITPSRSVMRDLDALPMPAWDLIDISSYREIWNENHGYFSLNLATTRGCPFKCNWCAKPIYGNRYNSRSAQQVADEIQYLLDNYQPDHFWMCDDIFGLKPGWVQEFQKEVEKRNLQFRYKIQSRVDLLLEQEVIQSLKASGVETVWLGAESGSQKILDAMDKGTTLLQIKEATRLLRKYEIKVGFFLQFGYMGEEKSDIDATIKMVLNLMPDEIGISVSYPLPGTKFYGKVKNSLAEKQNWSDSNDLSLMFHNTYSPEFYKILHRYVHGRYRVERGWLQTKKWMASPFIPGWKAMRTWVSMLYHMPVTLLHRYQLNQLQ